MTNISPSRLEGNWNPQLEHALSNECRKWLVTGASGFIGSNLVERLLQADQIVIGLDNFSTGYRETLREVLGSLPSHQSENFQLIEGDIRDRSTCQTAISGVQIVLHHAVLGSEASAVADPLAAHDVNATGFLNMLDAARREGVRRFIYASSSSVYGDERGVPQREDRIGSPWSPYAATKLTNEIYAGVYARTFDFRATGLRYFNVFGRRQDPSGRHAPVVPKWLDAMVRGEPICINGDGKTSRDFCHVANVVQANIAAALATDEKQGEVYNVSGGASVTLDDLFSALREGLSKHHIQYDHKPTNGIFRPRDVRYSQADISKARTKLGFRPTYGVEEGLAEMIPWYIQRVNDAV